MRRALGLFGAFLSFVYLIFIINPIQMLTLPLWPVVPRLARRINRWCARSIWGLWVLMGERMLGIDIAFRGEAVPRRENAFLLPNHQSMADVFMLLCYAWRCGRIGDMKWFVKDIIKYVPGPGWGMWMLDCIFLKRDWMKDKQGILRLFAKYKRHQIPIFLISFLEGTRKTPANHAASKAYAEDKGLFVPEHTLVPRTKGFVATMTGLREHLDAVYDVTIGYPDRVPTLLECFEGRVPRAEIHVRRYAIADLPEDDDELAAWAMERFEEKDALVGEFVENNGTFGGDRHYERPSVGEWLRSES